jgi:hypothetical protein
MGEGTEAAESVEPAGTGLALDQAKAWAGHRPDELGGAAVGRVEGVFVDERSGSTEWLLARMGRFGHHTLVPARDAVEGVKRVWVPYTRDQIRQAPKIAAGKPLARDAERELLEHYGIAADVGRSAELAALPADAVSARPV